MQRLKILMILRLWEHRYPKHKHKFDMFRAIEEWADVYYWQEEGHMPDVLKQIPFKPDFVFHADIAWRDTFTPLVTGLNDIGIPTGCFVNDIHFKKHKRIEYFETAKPDLIFATYKEPFYKVFPKYKNRHRWMPFSINPDVIKDWKMQKEIDFLLMGQVHCDNPMLAPRRNPPKGRYKFREAVLKKMKSQSGFVFRPHPGHLATPEKGLMVNENYAKELNRAKMFFTCGGEFQYAVAKFFEAPGCRTLLLAEPNKDIFELGFKDGENFVACNSNDFYQKAMYYLKNESERQRITDNGYRFIQTCHNNRVRAQQFVKAVEDFIKVRG